MGEGSLSSTGCISFEDSDRLELCGVLGTGEKVVSESGLSALSALGSGNIQNPATPSRLVPPRPSSKNSIEHPVPSSTAEEAGPTTKERLKTERKMAVSLPITAPSPPLQVAARQLVSARAS